MSRMKTYAEEFELDPDREFEDQASLDHEEDYEDLDEDADDDEDLHELRFDSFGHEYSDEDDEEL